MNARRDETADERTDRQLEGSMERKYERADGRADLTKDEMTNGRADVWHEGLQTRTKTYLPGNTRAFALSRTRMHA